MGFGIGFSRCYYPRSLDSFIEEQARPDIKLTTNGQKPIPTTPPVSTVKGIPNPTDWDGEKKLDGW